MLSERSTIWANPPCLLCWSERTHLNSDNHASMSLYQKNYGKITWCRNPGLNQGPLDLQSNALPTELFRLVEWCKKWTKRFWNMLLFWKEKKRISPNVGLEPTTPRLRVSCSTDWANRADILVFETCPFCFWVGVTKMKRGEKKNQGTTEIRTRDLLFTRQAL